MSMIPKEKRRGRKEKRREENKRNKELSVGPWNQGVCWSGGGAVWLSQCQSHSSRETVTRHGGAGFCVSRSCLQTTGHCSALPGPTIWWWGEKWWHPALSSLDRVSQTMLFLCLTGVSWDSKPDVFKDPTQGAPRSGEAPLRPDDKEPFAGDCRVFCPWGAIHPLLSIWREGTALSQCAPEVTTTPGLSPHPRRAKGCICSREILLKPLSFSSKGCLQKRNWISPYFLFPSPWPREVYLFCWLDTTISQPLSLSLFLSLLSVHRRGSLPSMPTLLYVPQFTYMHLILPSCLPPSVEILLPIHRSISWVFQVIWPQNSCVWGTKDPGPPTSLPS